MTQLQRKADVQEYPAEPHQGDPDEGVLPTVTLLTMTEDPLGAIAAMSAIYSGRVVRSLLDVTDDDRYKALADVQKTHLKAPLEAVKLHFLIEGVDRSFTHQHVRQRTAVYAQESMRFAVLGDLLDATTLPPSLQGTKRTPLNGRTEGNDSTDAGDFALKDLVNSHTYTMASEDERMRMVWDYTIQVIDESYHLLTDRGMPAEEARGLLPHATATRIHYITDLRNLSDHAGNRLCTQAQFHWRMAFAGMVQAISNYTPAHGTYSGWEDDNRWQFESLAQSGLFRPVCYQLGRCPFQASFDRACSIRKRVEDNAAYGGRSSEQWDTDYIVNDMTFGPITVAKAINPTEWLLDPTAARVAGGESEA